MKSFDQILRDITTEFEQNPNVFALLVTGSVARGEAKEGNDIDILLVTNGEKISKEYREGESLIEVGTIVLPQALENIKKNPMLVYMYLDAKAVFDTNNCLNKLQKKSREVLDAYRPTEEERKELRKWLSSVADKVAVAHKNRDYLKVGFHVSNVLWKMVEGLYLVNNMPVPASTSALMRLGSLKILPENFENIWKKTLLGNLNERTSSTLLLINFMLLQMNRPLS